MFKKPEGPQKQRYHRHRQPMLAPPVTWEALKALVTQAQNMSQEGLEIGLYTLLLLICVITFLWPRLSLCCGW